MPKSCVVASSFPARALLSRLSARVEIPRAHGGGHRVLDRPAGKRNRQAHRDPGRRRKVHGRPNLGYAYLHTALDDHSRLAYTEILADETRETAAAFLARAHASYAAAGITIERVLTDKGPATGQKRGPTGSSPWMSWSPGRF